MECFLRVQRKEAALPLDCPDLVLCLQSLKLLGQKLHELQRVFQNQRPLEYAVEDDYVHTGGYGEYRALSLENDFSMQFRNGKCNMVKDR